MKCKSSYWKRPSCARTIKWDRKTGNECYVLFLIHFRHVLTAKINQLINRLSLVFSRQNLRVQKCGSVERNFVLIRLFCFLTYTICYYKNKDNFQFSRTLLTTSCDWFTMISRVCCNWSERKLLKIQKIQFFVPWRRTYIWDLADLTFPRATKKQIRLVLLSRSSRKWKVNYTENSSFYVEHPSTAYLLNAVLN